MRDLIFEVKKLKSALFSSKNMLLCFSMKLGHILLQPGVHIRGLVMKPPKHYQSVLVSQKPVNDNFEMVE